MKRVYCQERCKQPHRGRQRPSHGTPGISSRRGRTKAIENEVRGWCYHRLTSVPLGERVWFTAHPTTPCPRLLLGAPPRGMGRGEHAPWHQGPPHQGHGLTCHGSRRARRGCGRGEEGSSGGADGGGGRGRRTHATLPGARLFGKPGLLLFPPECKHTDSQSGSSSIFATTTHKLVPKLLLLWRKERHGERCLA